MVKPSQCMSVQVATDVRMFSTDISTHAHAWESFEDHACMVWCDRIRRWITIFTDELI